MPNVDHFSLSHLPPCPPPTCTLPMPGGKTPGALGLTMHTMNFVTGVLRNPPECVYTF